jgi:two-component system response regulator NreC
MSVRMAKSKDTSIVLADDHAVVRQGLRALLDAEPGLTVVGEAADGIAAVDLVEKLRPAVLVVDIMMPGLGGLDVTQQVTRRRSRKTKVVVLSMHSDEAYRIKALQNGALAYVRKDAGASELIQAIQAAAGGRHHFNPPFSDQSIEIYRNGADKPEADPYETLTRREKQIFLLTAQGLSQPGIAEKLFIATRTVETHRRHIYRKLGVRSQADIVRIALERGLLPLKRQSES